MQKYGIIATLLLILGSFALAQPTHAESEPNDTPAQAIPIELGYDNGEVGATLTEDDEDYYRFEAVANRTYVIETYNIDGTSDRATGLWLYNASETEIANDEFGNNGTGSANTRIVFKPASDGTYFIRVRRATFETWTGTYSLRVLPRYDEPGAGWNADNDNEPNDTFAIANEIDIGLSNAQTHMIFDNSNLVSANTDQDFYHFEAVADRTYVIETYNIDGTDARATGLWLYNESETEIADDEFGNNGTGNVNARIIFSPTSDGTYFIRVRRATFEPWTGTYSLRVLPRFGEPGVDRPARGEPNDVIPLANAITLGPAGAQRQEISANRNRVSNGPDRDFYRFEAVAGREYVIETVNVEEDTDGNGTGLYLYNEGGSELADDEFGRNGDGNVDAQITFTFANSGTYFAMVTRQEFSSWSGSYSIQVCEERCSGRLYLPLIRR
jgi:RNase P/RNase MRP subunit POP5